MDSPEITYRDEGRFRLPNITINDTTNRPILKYGSLRRHFLMNHKQATYQLLIMQERLMEHLADVQEQSDNRMRILMEQLVETDPPPEKEEDMMAWVGHMNSLHNQAEEVVIKELIYV